jgi:RNA polymerase sigma factor (sigma-70 family)
LRGDIELTREKAEIIFNEHSNYIYRIALYLTKSKSIADDITQETFIQVFKKFNTFDSTKPLKPWLYKVALNITRNILRKQKWLKYTDELPEINCFKSVEDSVLKSEEREELWRQINHLSIKSREVLVLHFYSGLKLQETSEVLGIPLGTCKSRLNYALNTLRKQIPQNEFSLLDGGGDLYETI